MFCDTFGGCAAIAVLTAIVVPIRTNSLENVISSPPSVVSVRNCGLLISSGTVDEMPGHPRVWNCASAEKRLEANSGTRGALIYCASLLQRATNARRHAMTSRNFGILLVVLAFGAMPAQAAEPYALIAQLIAAARNNDVPALKQALAAGAPVNARTRIDDTGLNLAARRGGDEVVAVLLAAGADVNLANASRVTPLMSAAFGGHTHVVQRLLDNGAKIDAVDRLQKTAMIYAAGEGHTDVVKLLLTAGVAANARYANDLTALMWAAGYGRVQTVTTLLAAGADKTLTDNRGKTAETIASENGQREVAAILHASAQSLNRSGGTISDRYPS